MTAGTSFTPGETVLVQEAWDERVLAATPMTAVRRPDSSLPLPVLPAGWDELWR